MVAPVEEREVVEDPPLAYSVERAAQACGLGRTLVWSMVRSGELPSVRVAGRVIVLRSTLEEWLRSREGRK